MTMKNKVACVFGGTGFIGRQVVRELAKLDITVKVATRVPERAYFLKPAGFVGQIVPFACDYKDPDSIAQAVKGCDYVVNAVGILFEKKRGQFQRVHVDLPANIASACAKEKVDRFVHISALGVENSKAKYAKSKHDGEIAVHNNFPRATILKPSVVFGEDDEFFNMFAKMSQFLPFLPLIGGGKTKFQPVFVGDVADAVIQSLTMPDIAGQSPLGQVYQIGGPEVVTFEEIYKILFEQIHKTRALVNLPFGLAKFQAFFMKMLPKPPLTPDQVELLKTDNVVDEEVLGLRDLGITPRAMEQILPEYLVLYRDGGRFSEVQTT